MKKVEMVRMESRWKDEQRVKSGLLISTLPHLPQPPSQKMAEKAEVCVKHLKRFNNTKLLFNSLFFTVQWRICPFQLRVPLTLLSLPRNREE